VYEVILHNINLTNQLIRLITVQDNHENHDNHDNKDNLFRPSVLPGWRASVNNYKVL
jgi:hypothetical protein